VVLPSFAAGGTSLIWTWVATGFPSWDPAGLLGSSGWGLWVAALGLAILLPVRATAGARRKAATESAV
jgi:hypothetical protein